MNINVPIDHLDVISGIGTVKDQIIQQPDHFTVYGSLQNVLTPERITKTSSTMAAFITSCLKLRPETNIWADFAGDLCKVVLEFGLSGIKKCSRNREIDVACEYILELIGYCKEDLPKEYNFIESTFIKSVVMGLPISSVKANNIYTYSQIGSLASLPRHVVFDGMTYRNIGYLIFCLFQSAGINIKTSKRVQEAYSIMGIEKEDIDQYYIDYKEDREEKVLFLNCMKQIFENTSYERFDVNPRYVRNVLNKLQSSYPLTGANIGKNILDGANLLIDCYFEQNSQAAVNALSGVLQIISDGSAINEDSMKEEYIKNMSRCYGSEVINYDEEIFKGAKDYEDVISS